MTCTAGPRHRFRQSLLLGWVKMPVKDWLLLHVAPCDSYADTGGEFVPVYFHQRRPASLHRNQYCFSGLLTSVWRGSFGSFLNSPPVSTLVSPAANAHVTLYP